MGSGNLFTLDLGTQLQNIGDSTVQKGVIVVRLAAGDTSDAFTAVQVACTHQGTSINYNTGQKIFICPNHGSEFNQQGAVLLGPAVLPLQKYKVTISGTQLTVSS
jgi:Rieske Fe-S protein